MGLFGKGAKDVWDGLGGGDPFKMLGGVAKMAGGAAVGAVKLGAKGVSAAKDAADKAQAKADAEASELDNDDSPEAGPKFCPHCGKPL